MIYFIRADNGPIKIGFARDVELRRQALQAGSHHTLVTIAVMEGGPETEKILHVRFVDAYIRGEWFRPSSALMSFISSLPPLPKSKRRHARPVDQRPRLSAARRKSLKRYAAALGLEFTG